MFEVVCGDRRFVIHWTGEGKSQKERDGKIRWLGKWVDAAGHEWKLDLKTGTAKQVKYPREGRLAPCFQQHLSCVAA